MLNRNSVPRKFTTGFSDIRLHLEVRSSPIQGKGLFTTVSLSKGINLFEIAGTKFRHEYHPLLSDQNPNWIGIGYEQWLELCPGDMAIYMNHSCNPNVIVNEKLEVVTIAPVKPQQELLLDYSTTELDPYWKMDCSCGVANCRKILRGFQFLPDNLQKKYRTLLPASFSKTAQDVKCVV